MSQPPLPPSLHLSDTPTSPRGRSLIATSTFAPGAAIASFPRPIFCLPDAEHVRTACDWCLRPGSTSPTSSTSSSDLGGLALSGGGGQAKLSICTGCRYVVYCSRKCQAAAWKGGHKLECEALGRVREWMSGSAKDTKGLGGEGKGRKGEWFIPTPVRAAMQLLLRMRAGEQAVIDTVGGVLFISTNTAQGILESNVEGFSQDEKVWKDLGAQAMAALQFSGIELSPEKMGIAAEGVRRVLCVLQTNAFDRRDEDVGAAGVWLDGGLAMANHSCLPNAYVVFGGRGAVLRAEREIGEGEEVVISYIDNTLPKAERHEALRLYHFECRCRRCEEDLDVYEVCREEATISLNSYSLQPDLGLYRNPPIDRAALTSAAPRNTTRSVWEQCAPLLEAKMYAVEPIPSILHDLVIRFESRDENFAYALSLACFLATQCHPYAHVAPFKPWRVKGLMMIAQLLSQTAPLSAMGELGKPCPDQSLIEKLGRMDQVSMCEAILRMVVYWGPKGHSEDWEVVRSARELLDDILQLQGRERESAVIGAWAASPERPEARHFFDAVVLGPIKELAGFALGIAEKELKGDRALVVRRDPASMRRLVYPPS